MTRILSTLLLLAVAAPATAELYRWTDANGRVHFSDTPPGKQKAEVLRAPVATPPGTVAPATGAVSSGDTTRHNREGRLQEAWRQEAEQKQREKEANDARQAEIARQCARLRNGLQASEGRVLYITQENGEREYLDDAARQEHIEKAQRQLEEHCQ
jgi:hypothetical protein